MSQVGAPTGNQNAKKGKAWADAIRRAIREKYEGEDYEAKLTQLARKLVDAADEGDMAALKEVGDRMDGKPAQSVDVGNKDGEAFLQRIERVIIDSAKNPDA